ncbi:MAG: prolyl oligopeptidase family serine peptidase, partial [Thermoguttaceae bacterium]|nr:prolyl oligopeptidase family serine peptidase [Thermoguttaceae bacterium]
EHPLTFDGSYGAPYSDDLSVSFDKQKLIAYRVFPGSEHNLQIVESSPKGELYPKLFSKAYRKPGDAVDVKQFVAFDFTRKENPLEPVAIDNALFPNQWKVLPILWLVDSSELIVRYNQRGHQVYRYLAFNPTTGAVRIVHEQKTDTFIDYWKKDMYSLNGPTKEIIVMSEESGWNHLYLVDLVEGKVKNAITQGEWVVRDISWVDWRNRTAYVIVMGVNSDEDPYNKHLAKVKLDGTEFKLLTEAKANHEITWSPDNKYFIDKYSTPETFPTYELRDTDGTKILDVVKADGSALQATGWKAPQPFVAKGRDGKTDIYGLIWRPSNFDPNKKYPVIDNIYAGPYDVFTPKSFESFQMQQQLAEIGFIVIRCDGMGTNWRSKAFHDVCWKNLKDGGLPDHVAWIKAAAEKEPAMDLTRVGIFGASAGGQNAVSALMWHNDFYKAAVAGSGTYDNRMDKIAWTEQWMGWPVDQSYFENSNTDHADLLKGHLALVVGEMDDNVDPSTTMQFASALVKAGKNFDLIVVPGGNHYCPETEFGRLKRAEFFVRHFYGMELLNND